MPNIAFQQSQIDASSFLQTSIQIFWYHLGTDDLQSPLCSPDLNHVSRAIIEHTGVYLCCQADQTCFLPQGDMSELFDVNASYRFR